MNFFVNSGVTAGAVYSVTVQVKDRQHPSAGKASVRNLTKDTMIIDFSSVHGSGYLILKYSGTDKKNHRFYLEYSGSFMNSKESWKGPASADLMLFGRGILFLEYDDAGKKAVQISGKDGSFRIVADRALFILEPAGSFIF